MTATVSLGEVVPETAFTPLRASHAGFTDEWVLLHVTNHFFLWGRV